MNPGIRIFPLQSVNDLNGRMSGYRSGKLNVIKMGNYPWRQMNHELPNDMKTWKGNGDSTTLLFSLKGLEILLQARRGEVKTSVGHFKSILFHKSGLANKQHTYQSVISSMESVEHSRRDIVSFDCIMQWSGCLITSCCSSGLTQHL